MACDHMRSNFSAVPIETFQSLEAQINVLHMCLNIDCIRKDIGLALLKSVTALRGIDWRWRNVLGDIGNCDGLM